MRYLIFLIVILSFPMIASAESTFNLSRYLLPLGEAAVQIEQDVQEETKEIVATAFAQAKKLIHVPGKVSHFLGKKIVDFGCGTGAASRQIRNYISSHGKYIGVDVSEKQITKAKELFPNETFIQGDQNSDAVKEALSDADILFMRDVTKFQQEEQHEVFIKSVYDSLKPGAILIDIELVRSIDLQTSLSNKFDRLGLVFLFQDNFEEYMGINTRKAADSKNVLGRLSSAPVVENTVERMIHSSQEKKELAKLLSYAPQTDVTERWNSEENLQRILGFIDDIQEDENSFWVDQRIHSFIVRKPLQELSG